MPGYAKVKRMYKMFINVHQTSKAFSGELQIYFFKTRENQVKTSKSLGNKYKTVKIYYIWFSDLTLKNISTFFIYFFFFFFLAPLKEMLT